MDFQMKAFNHTFLLLALLPIMKFIHKSKKIIHECIDFTIKPLKNAAEIGIMMSDPLGVELLVSYANHGTIYI